MKLLGSGTKVGGLSDRCVTEDKRRMNTRSLTDSHKAGLGGKGAQNGAMFSQADDRSHCCQATQMRMPPPPLPQLQPHPQPGHIPTHPGTEGVLSLHPSHTWQASTVTSGQETLPGTHPPGRPYRLCAQTSGRSRVEEETTQDHGRHLPASYSHTAQ